MRTIVVGDEKNLAALRKRILDPGVTGSIRKGIDEELRAANPHLDLDKLSPGAVVVVPDVPGVTAGPEDEVTAALPGNLGAVLGSASEAAGSAAGSVTAGGVAAGEAAGRTIDLGAARKELAKQLGSGQLAKVTKGDELLRTEVARLGEAVAEEQQRADRWQADLTGAMPVWQAGLDALRG
jgi:hypothetical protein